MEYASDYIRQKKLFAVRSALMNYIYSTVH